MEERVSMLALDQAKSLLREAQKASQHAYSVYSHFSVGAAVLASDGRIFCGANMENASFGLTLCAERVALAKAVSEGVRQFAGFAVWGENCPNGAITPCGACRQVMAEFLAPDCPILYHDIKTGELKQVPMSHLLPETFVFHP